MNVLLEAESITKITKQSNLWIFFFFPEEMTYEMVICFQDHALPQADVKWIGC